MGRASVLGHGPKDVWASLESEEGLGVAEELEKLHGVTTELSSLVALGPTSRFGDFFLSRIAVE
jgi:hypothetical protein